DELGRREVELVAREQAVEERRRELGAVELLRASVERREEALARREEELERASAAVAAAAEAAAATQAAAPLDHARDDAHVVVLPRDGYRLVARPGPAPPAGTSLDLDGLTFSVTHVGRSPLPGDDRRCAFLEPAA
ncbi:MAG: hypothetical protein ACRC50_08645, partial [Gaiella sp.]